MTEEYQRLWKGIAGADDKAQAVQSLAKILAEKKGRAFISSLDNGGVELCIEILGNVSCRLRLLSSPPQPIRQGIAAHDLKPAEKQACFVMLRRLTGLYGLLPDHMKIQGKIEVLDGILASSRFADLRSGTCEGRRIAVKAIRVTAQDDFMTLRKVSINVGHPGDCLNNPIPAILQGSRTVGHTISPEHPGARWGSGRPGETATRGRVGLDGTWEYYRVH